MFVYVVLVIVLFLSNFQGYAWEQGSGENIVKVLTQNILSSYDVKLEIISPEEGSEIYVKENNRFVEPFEFKVRITNLGNDTLNLHSNLKVSVGLYPVDGGGGVELWHNDDLTLESNKFSEESDTLSQHLISSEDGKPKLGEHKLTLQLLEYIGLNPQGTPSWAIKEQTSILLNFLAEEPTESELTSASETPLISTEVATIAAVAVASVIGAASFWVLKRK